MPFCLIKETLTIWLPHKNNLCSTLSSHFPVLGLSVVTTGCSLTLGKGHYESSLGSVVSYSLKSQFQCRLESSVRLQKLHSPGISVYHVVVSPCPSHLQLGIRAKQWRQTRPTHYHHHSEDAACLPIAVRNWVTCPAKPWRMLPLLLFVLSALHKGLHILLSYAA